MSVIPSFTHLTAPWATLGFNFPKKIRAARPGFGQNGLGRDRVERSVSVLTLVLLIAAGCDPGDGLDRRAITGSATLDGRPLEQGAVLFEPVSNAIGTAVGATIHGGAFTIARASGPVPGDYRVRIYSASNIQAPPAPGQSERASRPMVERIPERYNGRTTLKVRVADRGSNSFPFVLESSEGATAP